MKGNQVRGDGEADRAPEPQAGVDGDPVLRLIGVVDDADGPTDVAVNHDHYLYGAPKVEP
jgi:hypothetical protein